MKDNTSVGTVIKKSNIRIWIHQRDLAKLQQVVWEGHGSKLLVEHSNNAKVKKFLEVVPHILGLIRDIHTDVQNDDLESLKTHSSDPVPPVVLLGKDVNGLTALHKAAGLGRDSIVEYIAEANPNSLFLTDNEGRSPLHYAALNKDGKIFDFLINAGADESALDNKQKSAAYYKTRNSELDQKLLQVIPECPRGAKENFASTWDWSLLTSSPSNDAISKTIKKIINEADESVKSETEEPKAEEPEPEEPQPEEPQPEEPQPQETKPEEPTAEEPKTEVPEEKLEDEPQKTEETEEKTETQEVTEEPPQPPQAEAKEEKPQEPNPDEKATEPEPEPNEEEESEEPPEESKRDYVNESLMNPKSEVEEVPQVAPAVEEKEPEKPPNADPVESTEEGVIEGVVNGENEVESVNEQGRSVDEIEIAALIEEGNMEELATLVLTGDGDKLIGHRSDNPELQAFLDNVPTYMSKINKIHLAAKDGSLRDLQAALDRRKFAIARNHISPNEASPLHVATVFGNTSIVRYLAGRFPETVQTSDSNGRTPLHYAAVLYDNGHYYNLLVHLGADVRVEDKFGHTPDYYRNNQDDFSHVILLREFGAEDAAQEILNDKALGDPLIKGLTEVANKRPEDPIAYLATYLYNFANNNSPREKVHQEKHQVITGPPQDIDNNNAVPTTIDVVTLDPQDENDSVVDSTFSLTSRDEHGQSMLHFAAARSHGRNALFQLLQETNINVGYRDELYRTARDISIQANIPENTSEIDKYVLYVACKGDTDKLAELLLNGYDHITDIVDDDDAPIVEAAKDQADTVAFLQSILTFEEKRERVHHAIRQGLVNDVSVLLADERETGSGKLLAVGKNSYGRCTLHIAVLCQQEEIVDFLVNTFPEALHVGDNLERTALHYAMGIDKMESISKLLIKAGARRVTKDLKARQPTYYFMNKSDILRLQEEEEMF